LVGGRSGAKVYLLKLIIGAGAPNDFAQV
jgi:hypothetical protein